MTELAIVLGGLIAFFGLLNLFRMTAFLVGSDIYALVDTWKRAKQKGKKPAYELPTFSIVIPAYNEEMLVARCIESVIASNYPRGLVQMIVVDDGSTDRTNEQICAMRQKYPEWQIRVITKPNSGKARSLNVGMAHYAGGDLVMCLDADSYLERQALREMALRFENPKVLAVAANVKIVPRRTLFNLIQRFEYLICYQMKRAEAIFDVEYIVGGIGSVFRRSALKRVGYYDTDTVTEDIDLTMKIIRAHGNRHCVSYAAAAVAYTESVLDISGLIRQRFRWKFGRTQTFYKNKRLFFGTKKRFTKWLTWLYLPYAVFGEIAFLLEPLLLGFIAYTAIRYRDIWVVGSALIVISFYFMRNIVAEDTLSVRDKVVYTLIAPVMYLCFYMLSYVEYIASLKTMVRLGGLANSLRLRKSNWEHVRRPTVTKS